jgi:hypothetical protein
MWADPFENTAILALVRNAFIWLSEYSVLMIDFSLSKFNASARKSLNSIGVGVLDDADSANKVGLDEALKRYVEARPALKYTDHSAFL